MLLWATMATGFLAPVSAIQVGTYFVGQYYQVLQQRPTLVHQFYTDLSTLVHIDGSTSETASGMLQIHNLIMSLKFSGIEIKTAHSLESWTGGVLVMVSGSVQTKEYSGWRRFVQTFFLAPQEKGYFVLNDVFHLQDEEQLHLHQAPLPEHNNFDPPINAATSVPETVSDYMQGREIQSNDFGVPADSEETEAIDKYSVPEPEQHIPEADDGGEEEISAEEPVASLPSGSKLQDQLLPVEEPIGEPPKHTYASILRVAKVQSGHVMASQPTVVKNVSAASELQNATQVTLQQPYAGPEKSSTWVEDITAPDDEGEVKSVYVRNLPFSASVSELEREFKNFGRIRPDGVLIKSRKEAGVYYAFVEFEDIAGVQNALKASPIQFGGRQIYVEERRPGSLAARGRRGRGRGGYQSEGPRGRFGSRTSSRGSGQDGIETKDYNSRPRGNGYHQQGPRQERVAVGARNGQSLSNAAS